MKNSHDGQVISIGGSELRYTDTGSGNAVLLLQPVLNQTLAGQLASNFRVIAVEVQDPSKVLQTPKLLSLFLKQLSLSKCCLIAQSDLAFVAIEHAIESVDSVEALVLIAPIMPGGSSGAPSDPALEEIRTPALVLFGTRDQVVAPETGRTFARRIPKCFYTLVYDAGHDIGADRPQALRAIVQDFLEHREKFVVPQDGSAINP